ncbi:hypothetical protein Q5M85_21400 [Paraclostridium bifermentans]|nr:hypothetical protein [Paraclostridium bifermentans]
MVEFKSGLKIYIKRRGCSHVHNILAGKDKGNNSVRWKNDFI